MLKEELDMSKFNLIPKDSLTEGLIVDLIFKMFKHDMARKRAAAPSEFPRPDEATAGTQSAQTDTPLNSTTVTEASQNDEAILPVT